MDAIVAGKQEKVEGSLGVFKSNGKWTVAHSSTDYFNISSAVPDMPYYPDPLTTQYYLKVNSVNDTSFIINLMNCYFNGGSSTSLSSDDDCRLRLSQLNENSAWFGAKIRFGYNADNKYLIFGTFSYTTYLSDYIASFEIGTLE